MASRDLSGGGAKPLKRYADNRTCRLPTCNVRLSRYNRGDYCSVHEAMKDWIVLRPR